MEVHFIFTLNGNSKCMKAYVMRRLPRWKQMEQSCGSQYKRLHCFYLMKCVLYLLIQTEMRGFNSSSGWTNHHAELTGRKTIPFTLFFVKKKIFKNHSFAPSFFLRRFCFPFLWFTSIDDFSTKEELGALQGEGRRSLPLLFWQSGMGR